MIRLKVFLILALLIFVSQAIKADEWNYGANGHATLVGDIYTYSNIENTSNGGTITSKFTGQLINGKRNGVWKATKIYSNTNNMDRELTSGTVTLTRSYNNGIPTGKYELTYNMTMQKYGYTLNGTLVKLGSPHSETRSITGEFKDGKLHGKWIMKNIAGGGSYSLEFDNGKAIGEWEIVEPYTSYHLKFKDGYLIEQRDLRPYPKHKAHLPEDIAHIEDMPMQREDYTVTYGFIWPVFAGGVEFNEWIINYPPKSSTELSNETCSYITIGKPMRPVNGSEKDLQAYEEAIKRYDFDLEVEI